MTREAYIIDAVRTPIGRGKPDGWLHGIHPVPVERRVAEALERLRPRLRSSGGDVELVRATGEVILTNDAVVMAVPSWSGRRS